MARSEFPLPIYKHCV